MVLWVRASCTPAAGSTLALARGGGGGFGAGGDVFGFEYNESSLCTEENVGVLLQLLTVTNAAVCTVRNSRYVIPAVDCDELQMSAHKKKKKKQAV